MKDEFETPPADETQDINILQKDTSIKRSQQFVDKLVGFESLFKRSPKFQINTQLLDDSLGWSHNQDEPGGVLIYTHAEFGEISRNVWLNKFDDPLILYLKSLTIKDQRDFLKDVPNNITMHRLDKSDSNLLSIRILNHPHAIYDYALNTRLKSYFKMLSGQILQSKARMVQISQVDHQVFKNIRIDENSSIDSLWYELKTQYLLTGAFSMEYIIDSESFYSRFEQSRKVSKSLTSSITNLNIEMYPLNIVF